MSELVLEEVSLAYSDPDGQGETLALDEVDLTIRDGEFVVALGPSGCGKTTLLNLMAGFLRPTHGRLTLDGEPITGPGRERGVVFQQHALLPWENVLGNAAFGLRLQGVGKKERRAAAMRNLQRLGLAEAAHKQIYHLSGGMQQRLGLARALTANPRILLMDEPFGALDAFTRESMQELILQIWAEKETMAFFITHSVEEALFLATRLLVLSPRPGRVVHSLELPFCSEYLRTGDARSIKSRPDFIERREEVLSLVRGFGSNGASAAAFTAGAA
ncbi:taurine ABC transporter ATP-binding protein [Desulfohalovibrio reitneri]|uniref:taurine ABC transporter ATP-binding protein n=1 Tax=Desulfohalovibrio reitneri TaxID=1307759 RepID=UPI0004A6E0C8|nr:ATP-binding cassette domain-containing protein [Desulfohalovibrio reitneri]